MAAEPIEENLAPAPKKHVHIPTHDWPMTTADCVTEFMALFTQSARRIYGYINLLLPNQADADDAFQETSKLLWERFSEYQPGTEFRAWAFSIARFKVLEIRRKNAHRAARFSPDLEELLDRASLAADEATDLRFRLLADCFQKLPAADRDLIDKRYRPGASTKSVADHLQRSTDAIYRALRRVHKTLFDCIRRGLDAEGTT